MPRRKKLYSNPLPSELQSHPSSKDSRNALSYDEWTTKNARAKAIIMSTLVPGSEAWKIAEPLEYAADIWKALEEKYGPKDGTTNMWQPGTPWVESKEVMEAAKELDHNDKVAELLQRREAEEVASSNNATGEDTRPTQSTPEAIMKATPTEAELDQERRDRRFLWALLNGGKDKLDSVTMKTGEQLCGTISMDMSNVFDKSYK